MSRETKSDSSSQGVPLNILTILIVSTLFFLFPVLIGLGNQGARAETVEENSESEYLTFHDNTLSPFHPLLEKKEVEQESVGGYRVAWTHYTTITAYSSTVDQTNSEPFITASGAWVEDGIVAANFLPFNTKIRIPAYFGDKVFVVKDRMNQRFNDRVDIWFQTRSQAKNFGIKNTAIEILEEL